MVLNALCPFCDRIFSELTPSKDLKYDDESLFRPRTLSTSNNLLKCPSCNEVFSSMVHTHYEHRDSSRDNSEVEKISYFNGTTWPAKSNQPDPLIMKYFRSTLAVQKRYSNGSNCASVDLKNISGNDLNDTVKSEPVDPVMTVAVQESAEKIDFELNNESKSCGTDDSRDDEMEKLNSGLSTKISSDNDGINTTLGEDESFWTNLTSYLDKFDDTIASEFVDSAKLAQNESSETICNDVIQSNYQPQVETESNLTITPVCEKEYNSGSTSKYFGSKGNENTMIGQRLPNIVDRSRSNINKISLYGSAINLVYSIDTLQRVSVDEIKAKIKNNFTIDESEKRSFICLIEHNCRTVFTTWTGVKYHLFFHLFFIYCTICEQKLDNSYSFKKHQKTCKETSEELNSESIDTITNPGDMQFCVDFGMRRKPPNWEQFIDWTQPTYCSHTGRKVSVDEIRVKIAENCKIDKSQKRPFVCLIEHDCYRFYSQLNSVKEHLFSHFFFFNCSDCGRKLRYPGSLQKHRKICEENAESDQKGHKRSISVELNSPLEREFKMKKFSPNFSFYAHDVVKGESKIKIATVPEQSEISNQSHSITSSSHTTDLINMDGSIEPNQIGENVECCTKARNQTDSIINTKNLRKNFNVYRCLYCEYRCKPGERKVIMIHLNGYLLNGKVMAPACTARKELKPANPETGLFEQLEPFLV